MDQEIENLSFFQLSMYSSMFIVHILQNVEID